MRYAIILVGVTFLKHHTVYFCGYAKLPQSISANNVYGILTICLLINIRTGIIEDVSCTFPTRLAVEMVTSYLINRHIVNDYEEIISEITFRHQGHAQKSIIKACNEVHRRYLDFANEHGISPVGGAEPKHLN